VCVSLSVLSFTVCNLQSQFCDLKHLYLLLVTYSVIVYCIGLQCQSIQCVSPTVLSSTVYVIYSVIVYFYSVSLSVLSFTVCNLQSQFCDLQRLCLLLVTYSVIVYCMWSTVSTFTVCVTRSFNVCSGCELQRLRLLCVNYSDNVYCVSPTVLAFTVCHLMCILLTYQHFC
jgi:hypothetical protein